MADNPAAMEQLRALLATREEIYAQAQNTLDTTDATPDELTDRIVRFVS